MISEDETSITVIMSLVEPVVSFPTSFRQHSVCHPDCSHMKISQGRLRLLKAVWQQTDRSDLVWLVDATISEIKDVFFVGATNPQTGIFFPSKRLRIDDDVLSKGEFCCGGFSGWTLPVLSQSMSLPSFRALPLTLTLYSSFDLCIQL